MKKRFASFLLTLGFAFSLAAGVSVLRPVHAGATSYPYNPSYLINEKLFEDADAMSASGIQLFLNDEGSGIRTLSAVEACSPTTPTSPDPWASSYYPHCGKTESAATLIYDAAQSYHISPRVILATMQKEESLVTDPTPWQNNSGAVNCAMGYDSCGGGFNTFFSQVDNGTWQLRTDVQLMNGQDWWGYTPGTYPCASAGYITAHNSSGQSVSMRVYSSGLYPNANVTFDNPAVYGQSGSSWVLIGGRNPTVPQTVTLDSSGTAALYCYTPYVGPISTTGYSGSYNFVVSWDQWWGSSQGNYFDVASQSAAHQNIEYGHTTTLTVVLDNTSVDTWYSDDCAAAHGVHPYRLMTLGYKNTPFADTSATVTSNGTQNPAWLGTQNQVRMINCSVAPGNTATFLLPLKAPEYSTSQFTEFELVQDGVQVHGDDVAYFWLNSIPDYAYSVASDNVPPGIYPGDGYQITIKLKNTGAETWYNDANNTDPGNTSGHPIRLATTGYANSPFAYPGLGAGWLTQNQITMVEPSVAPGATGTFQAVIYAPYKQLTFNHAFRLVLDGVKFISGPAIPSTISIPQPIASYSIVSKSGPSTMTSGQTATFSVTLKNTGNMIWRNIHRKVPATSTELPLRDVRMMTWAPGYHTSYFWYTAPEWMGTHNQVTPSTYIAGPGDTATYNITFHAPPVSQKTFFNEQWTLVLDGQTVMPFEGLTFPITVTP